MSIKSINLGINNIHIPKNKILMSNSFTLCVIIDTIRKNIRKNIKYKIPKIQMVEIESMHGSEAFRCIFFNAKESKRTAIKNIKKETSNFLYLIKLNINNLP